MLWKFWVGLFVLLGAAAIGFLAFRAAGGQSFGKSSQTYTVYADFSDIGGLKTNAPVKSAGVLVGRVASIQLDPKSYQAKVALNLDSQYQFSSDVSAQILTSGLLGEQYIGLQQGGDTDSLAAGDTITVTSSAMVLENLIGKFMTSFAEKNADSESAGQKRTINTYQPNIQDTPMKKTSFISALSIGVLSISMAFASPADAVNQVRENSVQVLKILNSGDFTRSVSTADYEAASAPALASKFCEKGLRYDLTVPSPVRRAAPRRAHPPLQTLPNPTRLARRSPAERPLSRVLPVRCRRRRFRFSPQ